MSEETPSWKEIGSKFRAPFPVTCVSWKAQVVKGDSALAVAYIDARDVMNRLDQVVGVQGWEDHYKVISSAGDATLAVECTLSVLGHFKSDVGVADEDDDNTHKSAYSDAFKRAAVKWGIGRYLYDLPKKWVAYDPQKKLLKETPVLPSWAIPEEERNPNGAHWASGREKVLDDWLAGQRPGKTLADVAALIKEKNPEHPPVTKWTSIQLSKDETSHLILESWPKAKAT